MKNFQLTYLNNISTVTSQPEKCQFFKHILYIVHMFFVQQEEKVGMYIVCYNIDMAKKKIF